MRARTAAVAALAILCAACATPARQAAQVEPFQLDAAVRPQDDLYRYVNGRWEAATPIPPDKSRVGHFLALRDRTLEQLRTIVEGLDAGAAGADPDAARIRDLYRSFMDEPRLEALGLAPLRAEFARIEGVRSAGELPAVIARLEDIGVNVPYGFIVHQDARDATRYVVDLSQSGLGMPDRDYYLKRDDARLMAVRQRYGAHVEKMLAMAGDRDAAAEARAILALETRLAQAQWTRVQNRDPVKTYNPVATAKLAELAPGYDWRSYLVATDLDRRVDRVIVSQPTYLTGFARLVREEPLDAWKAYLRWRTLQAFAPYLPHAFVDEEFAFTGTAVTGAAVNRPRWERGIMLCDLGVRDALGRLYVARYFPPQSKARIDTLVKNLLAAYRVGIDGLDWMGPDTRREAQAKLSAFVAKIGYPTQWRDYSTLRIDPQDLVGNVMRSAQHAQARARAKLGRPVDRLEWHMGPQTVNAYYNPELNEVVFPAAILQAPFFDAAADDAVNYGAIGAVIGHEISHGFDDEGSQYDGQGNLRNWWTKEDRARFEAKTKALVAQYAAYSPVPGYHVNGELTLGENIADNAGLAIAYKAYRISLAGKEAPVVDGFTGDQRFFLGWARVWAEKRRDEMALQFLKIDPHSPSKFRANGAAMNQSAFDAAFGVKPGDGMYRAPDQRVVIW